MTSPKAYTSLPWPYSCRAMTSGADQRGSMAGRAPLDEVADPAAASSPVAATRPLICGGQPGWRQARKRMKASLLLQQETGCAGSPAGHPPPPPHPTSKAAGWLAG